ncbi:DUF1254 domain-containing protein [Afifella pfennigii]|uniref:DUF1254 domain-containing protein n=1 Tax=Afifella pfennigii TaxID=209897 RepID=UPI00047883DB|nr:DUF1254 domain-containing protein [Afifella pfennigii]
MRISFYLSRGRRAFALAFAPVLVAFAAWAEQAPDYAADVPPGLLTPNEVQTDFLGELRFFDGMPLPETAERLYDYLDFHRGVETFHTGMPAASVYAIIEGLRAEGVEPGDLGIFEELLDARSLFLTPNTTSLYAWGAIDLTDGPVVMEVPPGVLGMVNDAYFRYVVDLGKAGPDAGAGGAYLFLPPGHTGDTPDGYHVVETQTNFHEFFFRGSVTDGDTAAAAQAIKDAFRQYRLAEADAPGEQKFVNLSGRQMNTIHSNDMSFFEELNAAVQREPDGAFPPEIAGQWAAVGIRRGRDFAPDERMRAILEDAVKVGNATARALNFAPRALRFDFYEDRQWWSPFAGGSHEFLDGAVRMIDDRIMFHYYATGITPAMVLPKPGTGSAYEVANTDAAGDYLHGGRSYSLTLPAPIPAGDFWSLVVYSGQTRSILETDQKLAGLDSTLDGVAPNADGSYTIWFGPEAPEGREGNWIQTMPDKSYSVILRLYAPLQPWFDKTWKPGDFQPEN